MCLALSHMLCGVACGLICTSEASLSMEACLGEGFLQSVLSVLQVAVVSLQVCCMLASISEQKLQAFHLAVSRLQAKKTGLQSLSKPV